MESIALIKNGKLCYAPDQLKARRDYLKSLEGQMVRETIAKYYQPKSNQQLKAWWGLFAKMVKAEFDYQGIDTSYLLKLDNPTGIPVSTELLKEYLYGVCPCYQDGKRVTMRDMDTKQMATFFEECRNFAASQWHIVVPEPRKDKDEL